MKFVLLKNMTSTLIRIQNLRTVDGKVLIFQPCGDPGDSQQVPDYMLSNPALLPYLRSVPRRLTIHPVVATGPIAATVRKPKAPVPTAPVPKIEAPVPAPIKEPELPTPTPVPEPEPVSEPAIPVEPAPEPAPEPLPAPVESTPEPTPEPTPELTPDEDAPKVKKRKKH